jgi:ubiquinone/menaquinone biosynthesis C-methylase UbiE
LVDNIFNSGLGQSSLTFPNPTQSSGAVAWTGQAFEYDGRQVRVLAYEVLPSGWTDKLTHMHEEIGGSNHFIDLASRRHARDEVIRCAMHAPSTVLEIGCSSGFLITELIEKLPGHRIIGADYTSGTLEALGRKLPGIPLLQFDLTRCPLPDEFADVIVLLNVLEHINDDEAATAQLFRIVRPGGAVIIELPAGPSLFDVYDRVLMHHRRYTMGGLTEMLKRHGFVVEKRSHLGFMLYPFFYMTKRLNQLRYPKGCDMDEKELVAGMIAATRSSGAMMNFVMGCERALRRHVYLPFGVRCLVTCRKPGPR